MRRYSKAKATGNHVVFTGDMVIPVPFKMDGLVCNDTFAALRVGTSGMLLDGITLNFQVPAGDQGTKLGIVLVNASGTPVTVTQVYVTGVVAGGNYNFSPAVKLPPGSLWKLKVTVLAGDDQYLPQDMTATYQLRFANGPVRNNLWSATPTPDGIGFYNMDVTFTVQ
jgi:hypothetical protein